MLIDPQIKIFNPKISILHKIENAYYIKSQCPWHYHGNCLQITTNHNNRHFHCLIDIISRQTRYKYYNSSKSCDIPENFHDLIMLHQKLGDQYILPFASHFRVTSGETIGMFELKSPCFAANIIKPAHLIETFITYVVLLCEVCHRLGGSAPVLNDMKFVYTKTHPILADVHINNSIRRNQSKIEEIFSDKKWKSFLTTKSSKEIVHHMKLAHPLYFKQKRKKKTTCILAENVDFDDDTHFLFCKNKNVSLYDLLKKYKAHAPNLSCAIQQILDTIPCGEVVIV